MFIDVYSDVVCPWCYIGKARLAKALALPGGAPAPEIYWRAYQLYPTLPDAGMDRDEFNRLRWGSSDRDRVRKGFSQIEREAEAEGLALNLGAARRVPNTRNAHRLAVYAHIEGAQNMLVDTLFAMHFVEGLDVGDIDTLCEAARRAGLDADAARAWLHSGGGHDEVDAELEAARQLGISGVPSFVFAGTFAVPGAQSPETLAQLIARASERLG